MDLRVRRPRGNRFFTDHVGNFVQDVGDQPYGALLPSIQTPDEQRISTYSNAQWNGEDSLYKLGVMQLGARLYDPVIGRFLNREPLVVPRSAATTNPYAFAMNDPVNASDPSGFDPLAGCPLGVACSGGDRFIRFGEK